MKRCMLINTTSILPKDIDMLHLQFKSLSPARRQIQKALQGTYTLQGFCHDRRKMTGSGHDAPVRTEETRCAETVRRERHALNRHCLQPFGFCFCQCHVSRHMASREQRTFQPGISRALSALALKSGRSPSRRGRAWTWSVYDNFLKKLNFLFSMMSEIASEMTTDKYVW